MTRKLGRDEPVVPSEMMGLAEETMAAAPDIAGRFILEGGGQLRPSPIEGGIMPVLPGVVPAHAVVVVGAACAPGQGQRRVDWMPCVLKPHRLGPAAGHDPLNIEVHDVRYAHAAGTTFSRVADWEVLGPQEIACLRHPALGWTSYVSG